MSIVVAIHFSGYKVPYDLVTKIMPLLPGQNNTWQIVGSAIVALCMWLTLIYTLRYTLKLLLMYKGWMYEARGKGRKISKKTQLWILLVRILSGWNKPRLYSFQGSLPRLPLPSLHDTMTSVCLNIFCFIIVSLTIKKSESGGRLYLKSALRINLLCNNTGCFKIIIYVFTRRIVVIFTQSVIFFCIHNTYIIRLIRFGICITKFSTVKT